MAYSPIAFTAPNYRDYKNNWIKAYEPGTTTPKAMATDSTLGTLIAKAQLNIDGFIVSAGDALIIPYIDGAYDLWLFPSEAEADSNDTSNAIRLADNVIGSVSQNDISDFLVKEDLSAGGIYTWDAAFTYSTDDYSIGSDGNIYQALSGQTGNDPISSPTFWELAVNITTNQVVSAKALTVGSTLATRTPVLFSARTPKLVALNRNDADVMSDDLTNMVGYAAYASVTGGQGGTIYWVTNESDDIARIGSFRWAVEQVRVSATIGRVLFDPKKEMNISLASQVVLPDDITVDAPGRNVKLWSDTDITRIKIENVNTIIRRIAFGTLPVASTSTRDGIFVEPTTSDKLWIDECNFKYCADGCIDVASLSDVTTDCRFTISRCLFRNHDKVMLIGSLACYQGGSVPAYCALAVDETPTILGTLYKNWFDHTGQRHPKVVTKAFVHSVNNYFHISSKERDTGTAGANYGILTATGGTVLSEGNLFTSAFGSGQEAINAITEDWVQGADGKGAIKDNDSVVTDSMTITEVDTAKVPTPPYTLTPDVITDTTGGRLDFSEGVIELAGADIDSTVDGVYIWDENNTQHPDGEAVYAIENTASGRYLLKAKLETNAPGLVDENTNATLIPRANTVTISGGALALSPVDSYVAIATEGAAASDDIDTMSGLSEDQIYYARASSSGQTPVFKHAVDNVYTNTGADITLDHLKFVTILYDKASSRYFISL
jgi:pectate lyase